MIAAVVRSDLCQRIPVKYSSVDPGSTRSAPTLRCAMSACTLAIRARRSSTEIACAPRVRDFSCVPDDADEELQSATAMSGAAEALRRMARLDNMVSLMRFF
jgi:hypothetical protein